MKLRTVLSRLGRFYHRAHRKLMNPTFYRDHYRLWCEDEELYVQTQEGFSMYASPYDYVSHQIYFFGIYDASMTTWLKAHVREGDVCWDVGAERGWFSLLMGYLVGPSGYVDAFEADPHTFAKLKRNLTSNKFHWVTPHNLAILAEPGQVFFDPSVQAPGQPGHNHGCGHVVQSQGTATVTIPASTLDEMADTRKITRLDYLKLDIEGAEVEALTGAQRTIERFRPTLLVEYNRSALNHLGATIEKLDQILDEYGYDRYTFHGRLQKIDIEMWRQLPDSQVVYNVYCLPKESKTRSASLNQLEWERKES